MASGTFYPAVSGDDGYVTSGEDFWATGNNIIVGNENDSWIRFTTVNIPQGSTITSAFLRLTAGTNKSSTDIIIYGNDADNAAAPTSYEEYNALTETSASETWATGSLSGGTQYDTPSIVSIIQEIVNRGGWSSGNALQLLLKDDASSNDAWFYQIDKDSGDYKAEVHVEWSTDTNVSATCPTLTLTAHAATISYDLDIAAETASLTLTEQAADVGFGVFVAPTPAELTLTANQATITHDRNVLAAVAALTLNTPQADVNLNVSVDADCPGLTLSTHGADIEEGIVHVNAACHALTLTEIAALISYDIEVEVGLASLAMAAYDAQVWDGAAWDIWITANEHKIIRYYYLTLTGSADGVADVTLPMSSFQARKRSGEPTFMAAVIPGTDYEDEIAARTSGELIIDMAYEVDGEIVYQAELVRVAYENVRYHEGGRNQSLVVEGHRTDTPGSKTIELRGVTYIRKDNGLYTYRCAAPEMYLEPGDTARYDGNEITVSQVILSVSPTLASMEVTEET